MYIQLSVRNLYTVTVKRGLYRLKYIVFYDPVVIALYPHTRGELYPALAMIAAITPMIIIRGIREPEKPKRKKNINRIQNPPKFLIFRTSYEWIIT